MYGLSRKVGSEFCYRTVQPIKNLGYVVFSNAVNNFIIALKIIEFGKHSKKIFVNGPVADQNPEAYFHRIALSDTP